MKLRGCQTLGVGLLGIVGLACLPAFLIAQPPGMPAPVGIVLVADGAGDSTDTSNGVAAAVREQGLPLQVLRWSWSHGLKRVVADQTDEANLRGNGRCMAEYLVAYRQQHPNAAIYLIG